MVRRPEDDAELDRLLRAGPEAAGRDERRGRQLAAVIGLELQHVFIPPVAPDRERLIGPNPERRRDPLEAWIPLQLEVAAVLEEPRHRDVIGVRHLLVRLIRVDVVTRVRMQLADAEPPPPLRTKADPEVGEMFSESRWPFDEPEVVAEVVTHAEQRVLRVQEVVV